jgi:hypothetical protein
MGKHHVEKTAAHGKSKLQPLLEYHSWSVRCEFHSDVLMKAAIKQCMNTKAVRVFSERYKRKSENKVPYFIAPNNLT